MPHLSEHFHDGFELPAEVNWITASAVNPIKDRGQCMPKAMKAMKAMQAAKKAAASAPAP